MGMGEGSTVTKKETVSHAAKVSRMQRVYDMMRGGEWKEVCNDLQIFIKGFCTRCARSSKARMSIERHFFSGFDHHRLIKSTFIPIESPIPKECLEWIGTKLQQLNISSVSRCLQYPFFFETFHLFLLLVLAAVVEHSSGCFE